jgi:hypothetical protein
VKKSIAIGNDIIHLGASYNKMYLRSKDGYISDDVFTEIVSYKPPALILQMICGGGFGPSSVRDEITPKLAALGTAFISSNMWMHFDEVEHFTEKFYTWSILRQENWRILSIICSARHVVRVLPGWRPTETTV